MTSTLLTGAMFPGSWLGRSGSLMVGSAAAEGIFLSNSHALLSDHTALFFLALPSFP